MTRANRNIDIYQITKMDREELLSYLKQVAGEFNPENAQGEFNRKLYYAIRKWSLGNIAPVQELRSLRYS